MDAASRLGADVVLLIMTLNGRGYMELSLGEMINYVHKQGLEVLLETHTLEEFNKALETDADIVGINNRDLKTFTIDTSVTQRILKAHPNPEKPVISESGITSVNDLKFLRSCGATGFLIGSAIMQSDSIHDAVRRFVNA